MFTKLDSPDQVAVSGGIVGVVWISRDEMHRSRGAGASSGPEVTDLNRAVSLDDGDSNGYASTQ